MYFYLFFLMLIPILIFALLPWYLFLILSLYLFYSNRFFSSLFFFLLAILKMKNRKNHTFYNIKFEDFSKFKNFSSFNDFNNYRYNNENMYNNFTSQSEYERACEILSVSKDASFKEKKKVFFELAKKYHPDVNKSEGAETTFKKINEAWQIIEKYENM